MIEARAQREDRFESSLLQYRILKEDVRALDSMYLKVTLLYLTLSGALIATFNLSSVERDYPGFASLLPLPVCFCVLGILYRVRALIVNHDVLLWELEDRLGFDRPNRVSGLAAIRTSDWLVILVVLVTLMISGLLAWRL